MAGVMPKIGRDPFSFGDDYNRQMTELGARNEQNAQNTLMQVFRTEAARQQPWSDLPVDLAKQNNASRNALGNSIALTNYKNANKPALAPAKIGNMITAASRTYGLDPDIMMTLADIESSFDPSAVSKTGAKGLYQITGGYAKDYGVADPFDPAQNIEGAMKGTRAAIDKMQSAGVKVDAGTIYLAHQQGTAGAIALLRNPKADAVAALAPAYGGDVGAARRAIIVNGGRPGMSAGAFADMWMNKANRLYKMRVANRHKDGGPDIQEQLANLKEISLKAPDGEDTDIVKGGDAS